MTEVHNDGKTMGLDEFKQSQPTSDFWDEMIKLAEYDDMTYKPEPRRPVIRDDEWQHVGSVAEMAIDREEEEVAWKREQDRIASRIGRRSRIGFDDEIIVINDIINQVEYAVASAWALLSHCECDWIVRERVNARLVMAFGERVASAWYHFINFGDYEELVTEWRRRV